MNKECQGILEERLKLYKKHKAEVITTLQRITVWEEALKKGELWLFENNINRMLGMPRSTTVTSPTENAVGSREVTRELVEEWIEDDKSRMHFKKIEIEQIGEALKALTGEQRTIVESKYFEERTWRNIEILFNERHSVGRVYVTGEMLRKTNKESLETLWDILGPLLQRYLYFRRCV